MIRYTALAVISFNHTKVKTSFMFLPDEAICPELIVHVYLSPANS